jgi:glucose-6-phosphate 1-dehydrogenase
MKAILKFIILLCVVFTAVSCNEKRGEAPTVMVVFGATGDLTAKKILPAIDQLDEQGRLPESFVLIGAARKAEEEFRKKVSSRYPISYAQVDFEQKEGYERLAQQIAEIDKKFGAKSNRLYFLATQPSSFSSIVEQLSEHGLLHSPKEKAWSRVVIEKPFGRDLPSAIALQAQISQHLDESQVYLVDHYLGKEGVRNLMAFRQSGEWESKWNKENIDRIDITLSEEIGIGGRAKFWEETGLLRDVVQNHIMQLISLVAMEQPASVQNMAEEKIKVLQAIRPLDVVGVTRGQYGPGEIKGERVVGYREEEGVPFSSTAETFAAATLYIDNDRWSGVPFHIQGGKRLSAQLTEIVVRFKSEEELHIRIQPKPAIFFKGSPEMVFEPFPFSEAYQKLIYDCMRGDKSSFVQHEEQLAAWRLLTPVLEYWQTQSQIEMYSAGTI